MKHFKSLYRSLPLIFVAFLLACSNNTEDGPLPVNKVILTAGSPVSVGADATSAEVSFTGAAGLTLAVSDFTVPATGAIAGVTVSNDTATVTVTFAKNTEDADKQYVVGIASDSKVIKGSATVTITQSAKDTRLTLTAGSAVTVAASFTTADAIFTGPTTGMANIAVSDFTVTETGTITNVSVTGGRATVTVTFAKNTGDADKQYIVGISPDSNIIKGNATVTITQFQVKQLTAGSTVSVDADATSAEVSFIGATGLTLAVSDFTVTATGTITDVTVSNDRVTVTVTFAENNQDNADNEYVIGIAPDSEVIKGNATVTITQKRIEYKNVSGTVTSDGVPMADATVTISRNDVNRGTTTTGADGAYSFSSIATGSNYIITVSKEGYETRLVPVTILSSSDLEVDPINIISKTKVYYDDEFNTLDTDIWNVYETGDDTVVEIVDDPDDSGNKLLHIFKSANSNQAGIANKDDAGAYGIFTVETRVKRSVSVSTGTGQYHIYTYQRDKFTGNASANPSANIVMVGGKIKSHFTLGSSTVTDIMEYEADTWYKITMVINSATNEFSFYVDGVFMRSGSVRTAFTTLDVFNITSGGTGSGFGDFWVDYVKIYQGEPK